MQNSNLSKIVFGTATLNFVSGGQYLTTRIALPTVIQSTGTYVAIFSVIANNADYSKIYADKTESGFVKFTAVKGTNNYASADFIYINYVLAAI